MPFHHPGQGIYRAWSCYEKTADWSIPLEVLQALFQPSDNVCSKNVRLGAFAVYITSNGIKRSLVDNLAVFLLH